MEHICTAMNNKSNAFLKPSKNWWGHIWKGLLSEQTAKHYKAMGKAIWLYLYLIVHANRKTGVLFRQTKTIATDMGIPIRTIQQWLTALRKGGYIITQFTGRSLIVTITKWRPITKTEKQ